MPTMLKLCYNRVKVIFYTGTVYFIGGTKQPKMIFKGSEYFFEKRSSTKTLWKCTMYSKRRCRARVCTYGNTVKLTYEEHTHEPTISKEKYEKLVPYAVSIIR